MSKVTVEMIDAADSVLSRTRPGIPDDVIYLAIYAALSKSREQEALHKVYERWSDGYSFDEDSEEDAALVEAISYVPPQD